VAGRNLQRPIRDDHLLGGTELAVDVVAGIKSLNHVLRKSSAIVGWRFSITDARRQLSFRPWYGQLQTACLPICARLADSAVDSGAETLLRRRS
jgi:hypothetical protein